VLRDYLKTLDGATERVERLTQDIEEIVEVSALAPLVKALQAMRGDDQFGGRRCGNR
jgi:hypothetical protein